MRRTERLAAGAVLGFLAVKLGVLLLNLRWFPVLRRDPRSAPRSGVSLLVPARDEAANLRTTLNAMATQTVDEVLVLDDRSTDETAAVVTEAATHHARVRLLTGSALPAGWTGKNWACHQLAQAANGQTLVFCDADVTLAPGAIDATLEEMARQRAAVFSVFPRQEARTLGERLSVPLIDDVLLCLLPHRLLSLPIPDAATANGQLLVFTEAAYAQLDGHRGVRASIVEDVRLARDARRDGLQLGLALGGDLVSTRMYDSYAAAAAGIGKSLLAAHGGSRAVLAASAGWHLAAYTLPWVRLGRPVWVVAAAAGLLERVLVNAKTGRRSWWEAALVPVTPLAALPVYARAMGRAVTWKGRTYP